MLKFLSDEKIIVGYDLGDDYSQISYCIAGSGDVETLSQVAGEENFNIPTVLCKREGVNQWLYGKEALRYAEESGGILVENLVGLAMDGELVLIEGANFDPVTLLTLFLKRSLGLLSQVSSPDRIAALMITAERMNHRLLEVLHEAVDGLKLRTDKVFFQSHTESFYYYMIYQEKNLWSLKVLLLEYQKEQIRVYAMECNKHTTPVVVFIEEMEYSFAAYEPGGEELSPVELMQMDRELLHIGEELCSGMPVSGIYLIGDRFSEEWMKESRRFLCRGRRVFQGSNLYSKGACYGMMERLDPSEAGKGHVYLGREKLKSNIGMKILRQGEEIYYALLDAGVNWFEAEQEFDFYLQDGNLVEFVITSLIGRNNKLAQIVLEDLPEGLTRIRARLYLEDETRLMVELEDLGLGVFRPATHQIWKEEIEL